MTALIIALLVLLGFAIAAFVADDDEGTWNLLGAIAIIVALLVVWRLAAGLPT